MKHHPDYELFEELGHGQATIGEKTVQLALPLPKWKFKTVDQLLADPRMRLIVEEVVEGNIDDLKAVGKDLNKVQRKALLGKGGVIDQFKANPIGTFEQILAYDN